MLWFGFPGPAIQWPWPLIRNALTRPFACASKATIERHQIPIGYHNWPAYRMMGTRYPIEDH
jgi:hypothetical protein